MPVETLQDYQVNDLVVSTKKQFVGIGCVAKILTTKVMVVFDLTGCCKCFPTDLKKIDVSYCKTVPYSEYLDRIMKTRGISRVIIGNEVRDFVGIGWTYIRVVTENDLAIYPRVV